MWENRKKGDIGNDCLISVDGTDFKVTCNEAAFRSYKFRKNGLRYEVGICIMTGHIVWLMGPFPAGDWNDITIFRFALKHMLEEHERVEADDGYRGENPGAAKIPGSQYHNHDKKQKKVRGKVRSRQEGVNRLFKLFKILDGRFDHDMGIHGIVVRAVVVLVQLSLENGFLSVFDVSEYEDP